MDTSLAIAALAALAQPTRLEAFRLLVRHEPQGLAAGDIALRLNVPQNTLSSHLSAMSHAGLIIGQRHSRSIIYRVHLPQLQALILFLLADCCEGRAEICAPIIKDLTPCCS